MSVYSFLFSHVYYFWYSCWQNIYCEQNKHAEKTCWSAAIQAKLLKQKCFGEKSGRRSSGRNWWSSQWHWLTLTCCQVHTTWCSFVAYELLLFLFFSFEKSTCPVPYFGCCAKLHSQPNCLCVLPQLFLCSQREFTAFWLWKFFDTFSAQKMYLSSIAVVNGSINNK